MLFRSYQIAVINGYKGSQAEWLTSLVGDKGDKGEKGEKGEPGDKGDPGKDATNNDPNAVHVSGNQAISGVKNFIDTPTINGNKVLDDSLQIGGRNLLIKGTLIGSTNVDDATGELASAGTSWTTTDWIPVSSDAYYTWQAPNWHHVQRIYEYDSNKEFVKLDQSSWNQFIYTIKTQPNTK